MSDFSYDVKKHYGTILDTGNGWKKEINLVSWNGHPAKLDIREWSSDKSKMKRGITFSKDEVVEIKKLIDSIDVDDIQAEAYLRASLS